MRCLLGAIMALVAAIFTIPAAAHENLPIVVSLEERAPGAFTLAQRLPGNIDPAKRPDVTLAAPCRAQSSSGLHALYACPPDHRPDAIVFSWPGGMPSASLLVRTRYLNGQEHSEVGPLPQGSLPLPETESAGKVMADYVVIGLEHILFGLDHLLFLTCLVIVAGTARRTVVTVTGFTLGHAVTITLASLGFVHINGGAVEVLIALSIVFLAAEILRGRRDTLTFRYPAIVATVFGLLHGIGFAGALAEIGLAQTAIALSLFGFNLGVEIGQMVFVCAIFASVALWRRRSRSEADKGTVSRPVQFAAYVVGILSAYWVWERGLGLLA